MQRKIYNILMITRGRKNEKKRMKKITRGLVISENYYIREKYNNYHNLI